MAVPVLAVVAKAGGARIVRPRGAEWLWLAGVAAVGLALFNVAVMRGVAHAEPAAVAVATACVPVLLGIVGPAMERTWPRARVLSAAIVVTIGSILVEGGGRTDTVGVLWVVVALVCEAAFTLLAVPVPSRHSAWGVSFHSVWMATVLLAAVGLATGEAPGVGKLDAADYGAITYLAVMATATTFVLWYSATAMLGADRVGLLTGISRESDAPHPAPSSAPSVTSGGHVPSPAAVDMRPFMAAFPAGVAVITSLHADHRP